METYKKVMWGSVIVAGTATVLLIFYFFVIRQDTASPGPNTGTEKSVSGPLTASLPQEAQEKNQSDETPPLDVGIDESDNVVRELLRPGTSHTGFDKWLKNNDLIRKAVAVVVNIANGESPSAHLGSLLPAAPFKVKRKYGKIYLDPACYKRYDQAAAVFSSLNSDTLVTVYRRARPLIDEAFKDLGYSEASFDKTLQKAIQELLDVPIVETDILLEEKVTTYMFSDAKLEQLSPPQKHLLRMGPANMKKIRAKLREIAGLLFTDARDKRF